MDYDEACDDAEEIEFSLTGQARLDEFRRRADQLERGETGRAVFLCHLAESLGMVDRYDEARAVMLEVIDDGGPTIIHPWCELLEIDLSLGHDNDVDVDLRELLAASRADELDPLDYEHAAESLEHAGRLRQALRWFTLGLLETDPAEVDLIPIGSLNGRYRVRRELGLPMDAYDEATEPARAYWKSFIEGDD